MSPHLDDAVFSCGQLLAAHPDATVVTVLAGVPASTQPLPEWDEQAGFASATAAVQQRLIEDARACATLSVTRVCLDLLDGQYERPDDHETRLRDELVRVVGAFPDGPVYVPLGIRHPDHQLVGRIARDAAADAGAEIVVYEELPYRVQEPDEHLAARVRIHEDGWLLEARAESLGDVARKHAAIDCYASQERFFPRADLVADEQYFDVGRRLAP